MNPVRDKTLEISADSSKSRVSNGMKLVIATPLYPPEIGGPASYAKALNEGLVAHGHTVALVKFSDVRRYPKGLRHIIYFWRVFSALRGADAVIGFDTWSTGVPALLAAKLRGKKMLVRIGGDFLWEAYVQRTHKLVRFSEFYNKKRNFSLKERLTFAGTRWLTRYMDMLVFNTAWQKDLWEIMYGFNPKKAMVIGNEYPAEREVSPAKGRVFVAAARANFLKNTESIEAVFRDLKRTFPDIELDVSIVPPDEHKARIRDAYVVVIPSVSEMSPNTAVDAIRYGKPFIMTSDTGARKCLGSAGIFVDTLNAGALRQTMEKLLDAEEYARACARVQAFKFSHSWEEVVKEFITVLNKLCAS